MDGEVMGLSQTHQRSDFVISITVCYSYFYYLSLLLNSFTPPTHVLLKDDVKVSS